MLDESVTPSPSYWMEYSTTCDNVSKRQPHKSRRLQTRRSGRDGRTFSDSVCSTMPIGMKMRPTTAKVPMTQLGVRMGCQALSFCCLNGVSATRRRRSAQSQRGGCREGWEAAHLPVSSTSRPWLRCLAPGSACGVAAFVLWRRLPVLGAICRRRGFRSDCPDARRLPTVSSLAR